MCAMSPCSDRLCRWREHQFGTKDGRYSSTDPDRNIPRVLFTCGTWSLKRVVSDANVLIHLPRPRALFLQVDTSTRNPESVKQGYLFEVPVQKWSRTERAFKNRLLALTKSSVVEMDVATRYALRAAVH